LPIAPDLLDALRECESKRGRVVEAVPRLRTWNADLKRAGIPAADRKSARLTFGTHLALAGVELRRTQRLMRHSDPKLTATVYTDPALLDLAGEVAKLSSTQVQQTSRESGRIETHQATNEKRQERA
jgi:integrase